MLSPRSKDDRSGYRRADVFRNHREFDGEDGTLARLALHVNPALVIGDYSITDAQTEASALAYAPGAEEGIEKMNQIGLCDPRAIIDE